MERAAKVEVALELEGAVARRKKKRPYKFIL
jgi:hypothetical protein